MLRQTMHSLLLSALLLVLAGCGGSPEETPPPPRDATYNGPDISVSVETKDLDPDSPPEEFATIRATAPSSHHALIVDRIDRKKPTVTVYVTIETPRSGDTIENQPLGLEHELGLGFEGDYTNIEVYARTSERPADENGEHTGDYGPAVTYP